MSPAPNLSRPEPRTLDRLAIIDDEGRRQKVQPADVHGRFQSLKPFVRWGLIGIFVLLPWIEVGGHPAVLFDLPTRHFYLFGRVLGTGNLPFLFFSLIAVAWGLVFITTLAGRLWCGWGCPQTVYLEAVYRRIERIIEGNGVKRMALDLGPWTSTTIAKKVLKWFLWFVASFVIAHIFLSYFVSIPRVLTMVQDAPTAQWPTFVVAALATGVTYFNFAWFREQTCIIICPYGRLQSAMQDQDSITIGYDKTRGEPRGKPSAEGVGDCVDCARCVQVCPTGIDIRNGLQMECIGCAACVDACDDVMSKLHRPIGLVRYDSERGFRGEPRRLVRPRVVGYAGIAIALVGIVVAFATSRGDLAVRVMRPQGAPFIILPADDVGSGAPAMLQNAVMLHVANRGSQKVVAHLVLVDDGQGVQLTTPMAEVSLDPQERADLPLILRIPLTKFVAGMKVACAVEDEAGQRTTVEVQLLGPLTRPARVPQ